MCHFGPLWLTFLSTKVFKAVISYIHAVYTSVVHLASSRQFSTLIQLIFLSMLAACLYTHMCMPAYFTYVHIWRWVQKFCAALLKTNGLWSIGQSLVNVCLCFTMFNSKFSVSTFLFGWVCHTSIHICTCWFYTRACYTSILKLK